MISSYELGEILVNSVKKLPLYKGWTKEERDLFMLMFEVALDYAVPINSREKDERPSI